MDDHTKWTIETYAAHNEALRKAENKFQKERDRRYRELDIVRKEAEDKALNLAREIQVYKDEKANELREQINEERLLYVRKDDLKALESKYDALIHPLMEFMAKKEGSMKGADKIIYYIIAIIGIAGVLFTLLKIQ